jgi:hypothetical protein
MEVKHLHPAFHDYIEGMWSYIDAPRAVWLYGASYQLREKKLPSMASWPAPSHLGVPLNERASLPLIEMRHGKERGRVETAGHVPCVSSKFALLLYRATL